MNRPRIDSRMISVPTRKIDFTIRPPVHARASCESLVADNINLARSAAIPFVRTGERVEDTPEFSDALFGLWDAARGYDPRLHGTRFSTFAYTCCRNRILNGFKKKKRDEERQSSLPEDVPEHPEEWDNVSLLDVFFAPHPEDTDRDRRNKQALYDHYIGGKTWKEIGRGLNVTPTRAHDYGKNAISLIRRRFADLLET